MIDAFVLDDGIRKTKNLDTRNPMWIDISDPTKPELESLKKRFSLHALTVEDCSKTGNRVKLEQFKEYIFIILYGVGKGKEIEQIQLNFILGKNFLATVHKGKIRTFEELKKDEGKMRSLISQGSDFMLHHLIDLETDNYFPVLEDIEEQIDEVEDEVYRSVDHRVLGKLFRLKRQLLGIRRKTSPQKDVMLQLSRGCPFISEHACAYFRDIYDHIIRIDESIDDYREVLSNTLEVHLSMVSNRMNEVMKTLTIIATIMLPLTVITGIYGMNLNIPEAHYDATYFIVISAMAIIIGGMVIYFWRKRWL
jgi:magnesium transporter